MEREPEALAAAGGGSSSRGSLEERGRDAGGSWGWQVQFCPEMGGRAGVPQWCGPSCSNV